MSWLGVGIGQYEHLSEDGGLTWSRRLREVSGKRSPVVKGDVDISRLPPRPANAFWDFVTVLPSGFGVASGHVEHRSEAAWPASQDRCHRCRQAALDVDPLAEGRTRRERQIKDLENERARRIRHSPDPVVVKRGKAVVIPLSDQTRGHGTHTLAAVWKQHLQELLNQ